MKLELGLPSELEELKARRVPLIIPVGTIEYHGPHCALGCDTQIARGITEALARETEIVEAPPIWYGVASYAVGGPEKNTVQITEDVFEQYVYCILKSMLYGGWRNIYLLIHHQYEQESLMPMTLCCMKAGKKLLMEFLEDTRGRGWWGDNSSADYYSQLDGSDNPFGWIKVLPCMSTAAQDATGYDHAGKWETSLLSALCPEAVDFSRCGSTNEWFAQSAKEASVEIGRRMLDVSIAELKKRIV